MSKIHATAVVDETAKIGDDVEVGAFAVIEGDVTIGAGTVIRPHAIIRRYTTMGEENYVDSFTSLGGEPQDYKFDPGEVSYLRIGDKNIFREGVTISRATGEGNATVVGNGTFWMVNSHAGHNAVIGDNVIFVNCSAVAGYVTVGCGTILPANGAIHQFVWIGEKVMFQGGACASSHVPPYVIMGMRLNTVVGLNLIGLRRSPEITREDIHQIKEAFALTYRSGLSQQEYLEKMDACTDWGEPASKFRDFIHKVVVAKKPYNRGLVAYRDRKSVV